MRTKNSCVIKVTNKNLLKRTNNPQNKRNIPSNSQSMLLKNIIFLNKTKDKAKQLNFFLSIRNQKMTKVNKTSQTKNNSIKKC